MKTIAIMQPGYIPWVGFFELMQKSDIFVIYDIVQFDKNGWRNRNRIKSQGGSIWLTVPVHSHNKPIICETIIDNNQNWPEKHLKSLISNYSKAKYFSEFFPEIKKILSARWLKLNDLNLEFINLIANSFEIKTKLFLASQNKEIYNLKDLGRIEKLIQICKILGADIFYEPAGGENYLLPEVENFKKCGIEIKFQNIKETKYPQQFGEFISNLSALDLLLNCGKEGKEIIIKSGD
jgi:hypothetical protein